MKFIRSIALIGFILIVLTITGCNRSALRVPGASLPFPQTTTHYEANTTYPYTLIVTLPTDQRSQHYGDHIAGTKWTGCSTDPFWQMEASQIIQQRLSTELQSSHLFSNISFTPTGTNDLILKTEIHAFCSQTHGFLIARVAGISSLRIVLEQNGKVLMDHKFEKIITDADKEYSGSQVTFIEQAMMVTMADSLRELMKDMLKRFETEMISYPKNG